MQLVSDQRDIAGVIVGDMVGVTTPASAAAAVA
jgi:hypothetical protein